jgi:hypothetical protein
MPLPSAKQPLSEKKVRDRSAVVPLIVSYGGGVNSFAILVELQKRGLCPDLITFADTGGGKPETYKHLLFVEQWLKRVGFPPLTRVVRHNPKRNHTTLENEVLAMKTLPSRAFGFGSCADKWKIRPQRKHMAAWAPALACWDAGERPVKIIGYDFDELRRMQKFEDDQQVFWHPLVEWEMTREDCVVSIEAAGLPLPPGSACFFCPASTVPEILQLRDEHPDLLARALAMEDNALPGLDTVKGLGRRFNWREMLKLDEAKRALLPQAPVEKCTVCADGED